MNLDLLSYPQLMAVVFAILFCVTFVTLLSVRRQLQEQGGLLERMTLLALTPEARDAESATSEHASHEALQRQLSALRDKVHSVAESQLTIRQVPVSATAHEAATMARQGASAKELATRFAMSLGEAELMVKLQRSSAA